MADRLFDVRLIPEYSGAATDLPIVEWLEQVELMCELCNMDRVECVVPLRLRGGAMAVYRQLSKEQRADMAQLKRALMTAFAMDAYVAFDQFVTRRLRPGETVDVFLAELQRLALLVGEPPPDRWIACAFVSGLPPRVRQLLRSTSRMDAMTLSQLLDRARAILTDSEESEEPVVAAAQRSRTDPEEPPNDRRSSDIVCYRCSGLNHMARNCTQRHSTPSTRHQRVRTSPSDKPSGSGDRARSTRREVRCFRCGTTGHIASECQGNAAGDRTLAPVLFPRK